jgi:polysaccharide pyruvyl transferase WcaK-like protein
MRRSYGHEGRYLLAVAQRMGSLCPGAPVRVFNGGQPYEPMQSKAALARVHGVVSGFMHLLIIAASAGCPGLALERAAKFVQLHRDLYPTQAGLVRSLRMHNVSQVGSLRATLARFVPALRALRSELQSRLPTVLRQSGYNLDVLRGGQCVTGVGEPWACGGRRFGCDA